MRYCLLIAGLLLGCILPVMGQAHAVKQKRVTARIVNGNLQVRGITRYDNVVSTETLGLFLQKAVEGSGQTVDSDRSYFVLMVVPRDHRKEPELLPNGQRRRVNRMSPGLPESERHCKPFSELSNSPTKWRCVGLAIDAKPLVIQTNGKSFGGLATDFADRPRVQLVIVPLEISR